MATTTFPEFLRFRAGLLSDARGLPGLLAPPTAPQPPQMAPQAPQQSGGLASVLGTIFGGPDDPNLTPEQNQAARRQALIQAGLGILASDKRGLAAVAEGGLYGQQAGGQARQAIYGRTQQERIANALQDPAIVGRLSPEQRMLIRLLPPEEATKMLAGLLFAKPGEPKVVGDALVAEDGRIIYRGPGVSQDAMLALRSLGVDPATATPAQWEDARQKVLEAKKAGASTVNVGPQEGEVQKYLGGLYGKTQDAAASAATVNDQLDVMSGLLDKGTETGAVEAATLPLRQIGASLGVSDADKIGDQQLFQAISNKMALQIRQNMPGALSDNDIKFLVQQVPSLKNTPEGNRQLIATLKKVNDRQIAVAAELERYRQSHNGSLDGWQDYLRQWSAANPLFYAKAPF